MTGLSAARLKVRQQSEFFAWFPLPYARKTHQRTRSLSFAEGRCDQSMRSDVVRRTALRARTEFGIHLVSVYLALDEPIETLCTREPYLSRYGTIRLSIVGRLKREGFALIATLGRPHYDVVLPDVSDRTLKQLDNCFDPPFKNPGRA